MVIAELRPVRTRSWIAIDDPNGARRRGERLELFATRRVPLRVTTRGADPCFDAPRFDDPRLDAFAKEADRRQPDVGRCDRDGCGGHDRLGLVPPPRLVDHEELRAAALRTSLCVF